MVFIAREKVLRGGRGRWVSWKGGGAGLRSTRVEYIVSLLVSTLSEQTLACLFLIALLDKASTSREIAFNIVLKVSTQKSAVVHNKA